MNSVLGFLHDSESSKILLLREQGHWNGINGPVQEGELPHEAMARTCKEATKYNTTPEDWQHVATLRYPAGSRFVYTAPGNIYSAKGDKVFISYDSSLEHEPVRAELRWLIRLVFSAGIIFPVEVNLE